MKTEQIIHSSHLRGFAVALFALLLSLGFASVGSAQNANENSLQNNENGQPLYLAADVKSIKKGVEITLTRKQGGKIEGVVTDVSSTQITVKHKYGVVKVDKDDIASFTIKIPLEVEFAQRLKKCKTGNEFYDLGIWAEDQDREALARQAYEAAVKADPNHKKSHEKLGNLFDEENNKWVSEEDYWEGRGYKKIDGEWISPEEQEERKEEAKEIEEVKKSSSQLEREYIGRAWGEVDPIKTKNYMVYCNSTPEVAKHYSNIMEALFKKFSRVFSRLPMRGQLAGTRGQVFIYANHQQFMDYTGVEPGVGGFYKPWNGHVTGYHGSFGTTGTTYEVLAHEGTHQFQGFLLKSFWACPMWIAEGMAVFFGDGSEYHNGKIKIGLIPRDRLVTLQRFIEEGNQAADLNVILTRGQPFPGALYASAWGIVYWCLYGTKTKPKAHKGEGTEAFVTFLLEILEASERVDYRASAIRFRGLIQENVGMPADDWYSEYKDWVMKLPLEKLGKKKGSKFVSEKLHLSVKKPKGMSFVKDRDLRKSEIVAFATKKGGQRIASYVWPNWSHTELSFQAVQGAFSQLFSVEEHEYDGEDDTNGFRKKINAGHETLEAVFKGKLNPSLVSDVSDSKQAQADSETKKFKVVFYVNYDRIYLNVVEAEPASFGDAVGKFSGYLDNFEITFD